MADLPYQIVIGLEVHVQLLTQSKLFCGCSTQFGLPPNSATCPVCIGMPGVLPVMNRRAFDLALKAALALNCQIPSFTKWDRKNYYYPDLPKNYQISQYDLPFSSGGHLEIQTAVGPKRVRIIRVHLEEDAGKMLHDEKGGGRDSLVDLNRTGTPLLEIVSEPDLSAPEEAKAYLEEIRLLLRELEVSDCEMQEGSLRCDANVNIHVPMSGGGHAATPIVEIKNLNSFRAVERAIKYEAERQYDEFRRTGMKLGDPGVSKATAGWDDARGRTEIQRRKEEASDYRYFPEPDLVPVVVDDAWRERVRADLGELPAVQRQRLHTQYGLSAYDAEVLARQGRPFVAYFEEATHLCGDAKAVCNWTTNQVLQTLNERKVDIRDFSISAAALAALVKQVKAMPLNNQQAREVYARMAETGASAEQVITDLGITVISDESELRELVRKAIAANAKAVADIKKGKPKAADAIKGQIMRETKGKARIEVVQKLLMEELEKA
jgi:aspartyl-tRNA(Asn)/glutamyl-tRNA(Gln) amidotransferase subunit B